MPIGKNAIKRVENNGYSKVKTSAPDMENSHVIASPDKQVVEKLIAPVEKATAEKACAAKKPATTAKKTAVKAETKPATEAPVKETAKAPVKTTKKAATGSSSAKKATTQKTANKPAESKDGFVRVELGKGMPYYLL